jgi:hypothetical protein
MIVGLLLDGTVLAVMLIVVSFLLSRFTRGIVGRSLLAIVLIIAALVYVVSAVRADEGAFWVVGELVGVGIYGTMGLLSLRGSPMWPAAGWALHHLWDAVLHYFGPGSSFAPISYTIPCVSFELLVTVYIAIAYGSGLLGNAEQPSERPLFSCAASPPVGPELRELPRIHLLLGGWVNKGF